MTITHNLIVCPNCGHEFKSPAPFEDTDVIDCTNPDCKASITVDLSYELPDDQEDEEETETEDDSH